jgi:Uma2 family endonuclease
MAAPAESFPQHPAPWTVDELLSLPEDNGQRLELVDGAVIVSPAPARHHQRLLRRLVVQLVAAVPPELDVELGINVVLGEKRLLIPDLAVTTTPGARGVYAVGSEVMIAVEITSPSSRTYDRVLKRQLYADAGVPYYLVVDASSEVPVVVLYSLTDGGYVEAARSHDGMLKMDSPFEATLELA